MKPNKDGFIKLFINFLKSNKLALEKYKQLSMPKLNTKIIDDCIQNVPIKIEDINVNKYILGRYDYLMKYKDY